MKTTAYRRPDANAGKAIVAADRPARGLSAALVAPQLPPRDEQPTKVLPLSHVSSGAPFLSQEGAPSSYHAGCSGLIP